MSETAGWVREYSVNIAELDRQHQNLFRIVRHLRDAIASGHGEEVTEAVLTEVVHYTIHHFATEEGLMQQYGFPGTASHRIEHNTLTLELCRLQKEQAAGKPDAAECLLRFLQQWLKEHLLKTDKGYVAFLCSKGVV
jgi:hemerythrin-like metal-binding protein